MANLKSVEETNKWKHTPNTPKSYHSIFFKPERTNADQETVKLSEYTPDDADIAWFRPETPKTWDILYFVWNVPQVRVSLKPW